MRAIHIYHMCDLRSNITHASEDSWCPFLVKARKYILGLQDERGTPIMKTRRKTGFLGFLCCIDSVQALYDRLLAADDGPLTYKMSQDHLELFFAAVRACGRWNNNPTASQFTAAYKRLDAPQC